MYLADLEEDQVRTSSRPLSVLIAFVLLTSPCVLVLEHHCCYPLEKKKGGHEPVVCRILVCKRHCSSQLRGKGPYGKNDLHVASPV